MTVTVTEPTKPAEQLAQHILQPLTLAQGDDAQGRREFECLAIPYEVEVDRENWRLGTSKLRIEKGAATFRDDAKLFYGHDWQLDGMPIGRLPKITETDAGPRVLARISKTAKGDEVYALMQPDEDGVAVLDKVSIGFYITEYRVEGLDTDAPVLVVMAADVFELSVVPFPQYDGAAVDNVLNNQRGHSMTTTVTEPAPEQFASADDLNTLGEQIENLAAQIATLGTVEVPSSPAELFSSYGEYVKAAADAKHELHDEAQKFAQEYQALAYEGGVQDDTNYGRNGWVGDTVRLIERARKVWNLFDTGVLPAEGNTLEYGKIAENTVEVAVQGAEGDAIVMGNVKLTTGTAPVLTFAGGSELSLQQVKRSAVPVLDLHWRALAIAYAKATETYTRGVVAAAAAHTIGTLAALDDFDGWIEFLVGAALHLDDKGLEPEYLKITPDVFTDLAKLREGTDGPFLLNRDTGRINLLEGTGDVAGLKLVLVPGTGGVEIGNSTAVKTFESGGAPARLGPDEDITTLTEAIGVYGFGAVAVQDAKALVRPGA